MFFFNPSPSVYRVSTVYGLCFSLNQVWKVSVMTGAETEDDIPLSERKTVTDFCYLLDKSKQLFNGLRLVWIYFVFFCLLDCVFYSNIGLQCITLVNGYIEQIPLKSVFSLDYSAAFGTSVGSGVLCMLEDGLMSVAHVNLEICYLMA